MNAPATLDRDDDGERLDPDDEDTGPAVGLRRAEAQWWLGAVFGDRAGYDRKSVV